MNGHVHIKCPFYLHKVNSFGLNIMANLGAMFGLKLLGNAIITTILESNA